MIVISDTTPLNYLVLIGQQELLARLFERVIIPRAVWTELQAEATPEPVRAWFDSQPKWLEVRQANLPADAALAALGYGEQEAILLAQELNADLLLIDDKDGRLEAMRRNLSIVGTLGVLDKAAERGLLDLPETLARLQQTTFRVHTELITAMLEQDAERKLRQRFDDILKKVPDVEPDDQDRME
jgi:predicted nucleic acid-binding protein